MNQVLRTRLQQHDILTKRKNPIDKSFYNGVVNRYHNPVLTRDHVPLHWRFDFDAHTNPFLQERLPVNAVFNAGAIYHQGKHTLIVRLEGSDRKSIFALASSDTGIDGFVFERLINWPQCDGNETNRYDIRLTAHEDGYIYGVFCSESPDPQAPLGDTISAQAEAGLVRTKDLIHFERLQNLKTASQQRNVVLHPEFINGQYGFYTRPQDGFIETGQGGGIAFGLCENIEAAVITKERIVDAKRYHTIYEMKNGQGPTPLKTNRGWIHIAHGVRNTAAGLRYVLYLFATDLQEPWRVIAKPSGYFLAPIGQERIGDVSNVLFTNGMSVVGEDVFIYYASSDTRLHVATTSKDRLIDAVFNAPQEVFDSHDATKQRQQLIEKNLKRLHEWK